MALSFDTTWKAVRKGMDSISASQKITLFFVTTGVMTGVILLAVWASGTSFRLLYSNLSEEDAGRVVGELDSQGIPYEISDNGTGILVPAELVHDTRLKLSKEGIPAGEGKGYELFDESGFGLTDFLQNVNFNRALEGELSRTISKMKTIRSATVHLARPKPSVFIGKEKPVTASVMLILAGISPLDPESVSGIAHLVAGSVEGLTPSNVTILDSSGNVLSQTMDQSGVLMASSQIEIQKEVENYLREKAQGILGDSVGEGLTAVRVSVQLDFEKKESTTETYDPEGQVVRSETINSSEVSRGSRTGATGAGARTGASPPTVPETQSDVSKDRETTYEINKTIQRVVKDGIRIERLAVSLVVDESLAESLNDLMKVVQNCVGVDEKRGDTIVGTTAKFAVPEVVEAVEASFFSGVDIAEIVRYGVVLITFLVVFILLRGMLKKNKKKLGASKFGEAAALLERNAPKSDEPDVRDMVMKIIEEDPNEAVQMLESWVSDEPAAS